MQSLGVTNIYLYICTYLQPNHLTSMNIVSVREYCLALPLVTEDLPFDEASLLFSGLGKVFACVDMEHPEWVAMKCDAGRAQLLRDCHPVVEPAWHWNKKYWNQVLLNGSLSDDTVRHLLRHAYSEVAGKLKKSERLAHPEITKVE